MRAHRGRHRGQAPGGDRRAGHPTLRHRASPVTRTVGVRCLGQLRGRSRRRTDHFPSLGLGADASGPGSARPIPRCGGAAGPGAIGVPVATTVTWRGQLIEDPDLLARVDAEIAEAATRFGALSEQKLTDAIDTRINKYDPDAVRRFQSAAKGLDVRFGKPDDETGTRSIYGRVKITDAELMDRRAEALARSVCPDDPRTHGERRTEALGIIAVNGDRLPCRCGKPDCPAAGKDPRAEHLVIHIITNNPGDDHDDGRSRQRRSRRQRSRRRWSRRQPSRRRRWSRRRVVPTTVVRRRCWTRRSCPDGAGPDGPDDHGEDPTVLGHRAVARPPHHGAPRCRARPRR